MKRRDFIVAGTAATALALSGVTTAPDAVKTRQHFMERVGR
jgi:hypothetical protein